MTTDLAPSIITRIMREIRDLSREPTLPGIAYVEPEDMNSLSEIHAIITGPGDGTVPTLTLHCIII